MAADSQKDDLGNKWYIWACRQLSWTIYYYKNIQISSIWPLISKMATMDYPKILSFALKITAASQIRWFGKMAVMGYTELLLKMAAYSQKIILGINCMYWTLRMRMWFHKQWIMTSNPFYMVKGLLYIDGLDQKFYIFKVEWIYCIQ